jgi:transcriptional activator
MRIDIKLLGPLEATVNRVSIVPAAAKPRQLLALLALNADSMIRADTLMAEIWGDLPPRAARTTLHTYIRNLRKGLELALHGSRERDAKAVLVTEQLGYRLKAPPGTSDIGKYNEFVSAGRLAAQRDDYQLASHNLEAALALWRGPALIDVITGTHLTIEKVRLEETRLSDLDLRLEMDLRLAGITSCSANWPGCANGFRSRRTSAINTCSRCTARASNGEPSRYSSDCGFRWPKSSVSTRRRARNGSMSRCSVATKWWRTQTSAPATRPAHCCSPNVYRKFCNHSFRMGVCCEFDRQCATQSAHGCAGNHAAASSTSGRSSPHDQGWPEDSDGSHLRGLGTRWIPAVRHRRLVLVVAR